MGETLMKATLIRQEARRVWITVFIGVVLCLCTVALIPSTYAEADDLGAQMILAGEDGFAAAAEVPCAAERMSGGRPESKPLDSVGPGSVRATTDSPS